MAVDFRIAVGAMAKNPPALHLLMYAGSSRPILSTFARIAAFTATGIVASLLDASDSGGSAGVLPFWLDYASLFHIVMIACMLTIGGDFLNKLRESLSSVIHEGAADKPTTARAAKLLAATNQRLQSRIVHFSGLTISIGTCVLGAWGYQLVGVAGPKGSDDLASRVIYADAWSSWPRVGSGAFVLVASVGAYLILWLAYCVAETTLLFHRLRAELNLRLALRSTDGLWGWASISSLVSSGNALLSLGIVGVTAIAWRGGFSQPQYLAFFPLMCVAVVAPYMYVNNFWAEALLNRPPKKAVADLETAALAYALAPRKLSATRTAVYQALFTIAPALLAFASELKK